MNAAEARKRRGGSTLAERIRQSPERASKIDALIAEASIETMVRDVMQRESVSPAELARRVNAKPPQISRDLKGGLRKATLARVTQIAHALGYDFVPLLIPRNDKKKQNTALKLYEDIIRTPVVSSQETNESIGTTYLNSNRDLETFATRWRHGFTEVMKSLNMHAYRVSNISDRLCFGLSRRHASR